MSVAHLRARPVAGGTEITWIRRSRVDADSWESVEVPLGEEREAYLLRVVRDGVAVRTVEVTQARWVYTNAMREADGPGVAVSVAQVSARFGAGPFRSVMV